MIKKYIKHPVVSGSFFMLTASLLVNAINFLFSILVIKLLPQVVYGEYTAIFAYIYLLSLPFTMFSLVLIKKIGNRESEQRIKFALWLEDYVWKFIKKRFIFVVLIQTILFGLIFYWSNFLYWYSSLFIVLSLGFSFIIVFYDSFFRAMKWLLVISVMAVFFALLKLGFSYFGIHLCNELFILLSIFLFLSILDICFKRNYFKLKTKNFKIDDLKTKKISFKHFLKKDVILTLLTTFGVLGLINFDLILVKKFLDPTSSSLYGLLSLFLKAVTFVFAPLISVAYIFFTNQDHKNQQKKILLLFVGFFILVGILITISYTILGKFLVLLASKEAYLPIVKYLPLAGLSGLFYSLNWLFSQYFLSKESNLSILIFGAGVLQVITLYFFHQSYQQIFYLNLSLYLLLFFSYFFSFLILAFKKVKNKL